MERDRFKTAFVKWEEHFVLSELFGEPDVVAQDLAEAARRIVEWEDAHQNE